jgi:hypothetical protein
MNPILRQAQGPICRTGSQDIRGHKEEVDAGRRKRNAERR